MGYCSKFPFFLDSPLVLFLVTFVSYRCWRNNSYCCSNLWTTTTNNRQQQKKRGFRGRYRLATEPTFGEQGSTNDDCQKYRHIGPLSDTRHAYVATRCCCVFNPANKRANLLVRGCYNISSPTCEIYKTQPTSCYYSHCNWIKLKTLEDNIIIVYVVPETDRKGREIHNTLAA